MNTPPKLNDVVKTGDGKKATVILVTPDGVSAVVRFGDGTESEHQVTDLTAAEPDAAPQKDLTPAPKK